MASPKFIESLKIVHSNLSEETVIGSKLVLNGGPLMDIIPDASDNSLTLSAGPEAGSVDPALMAKYNAMLNGGSGTYNGEAYTFTGAPYYYSSVDGVYPRDGQLFLTVKQCVHWGLFEDSVHPFDGSYGNLEITDVCAPCVDCEEYGTLYEYMDAVKDALDDKKDRIYLHTPYVPGERQNNILELNKQLMLYWNNMVQTTSWRCDAIADGNEVNAACMITNHFDTVIPAYLELSAFFIDMPSAARPKGYIIDHTVPSGWTQGVEYTIETTPAGLVYTYPATWTANYGAKTLAVVSDTPPTNPFPILTAGDYVQITARSGAICGLKAYVLSGDENSFVMNVPDMPASGDATGTITWSPVVKFILTTREDLPITDSIKLYVGAIAPDYVGSSAKAALRFENNLSALGFTGFEAAKIINTNNMVSVNPLLWA